MREKQKPKSIFLNGIVHDDEMGARKTSSSSNGNKSNGNSSNGEDTATKMKKNGSTKQKLNKKDKSIVNGVGSKDSNKKHGTAVNLVAGMMVSVFAMGISFGVGVLCPSFLASVLVHIVPRTEPSTNDETFLLVPSLVRSLVTDRPLTLPPTVDRRIKAVVHGKGGCTRQNLDMFLHDDDNPIPGLHIACVYGDDSKKKHPKLNITLYHQATQKGMKENIELTNASWKSLSHAFVEHLGLKFYNDFTKRTSEKWAVFTPNGQKIADHDATKTRLSQVYLDNVLQSEMVLIFEGGTWIWPGVREGFERHVTLSSVFPTEHIEPIYSPTTSENNKGDSDSDSSDPYDSESSSTGTTSSSKSMVRQLFDMDDDDIVTLQTLSLVPLVLSVDHFLTPHECEHIIETATPRMHYSGVSLKDGDQGKEASNWRTSKQAFLSARNDPTLLEVGNRVASLTRIPVSHQEQVQVLRYGKTEKYDAHNDFFDPFHYMKSPDVLRTIDNGEKNRLATVFWYLSDVEQGGETIFPRQGGLPSPKSFASCDVGMKVKPRKGRVIIFYSMLPDGHTDDYSLHGACPVVEGVKWAANKWVWNRPSGYGI